MPQDTWDPEQYGRFAAERRQPFLDLLALLHPIPSGRAVDLGCGTGELTRALHERLGAAETLGIGATEPPPERMGGSPLPLQAAVNLGGRK